MLYSSLQELPHLMLSMHVQNGIGSSIHDTKTVHSHDGLAVLTEYPQFGASQMHYAT